MLVMSLMWMNYLKSGNKRRHVRRRIASCALDVSTRHVVATLSHRYRLPALRVNILGCGVGVKIPRAQTGWGARCGHQPRNLKNTLSANFNYVTIIYYV